MYTKEDLKIGDILVRGKWMRQYRHNTFTGIAFSVVVAFTRTHLPRAVALPYKEHKVWTTFRPLRRYTVIFTEWLVVPPEEVFVRGGAYEENYAHIIEVAKNDMRLATNAVGNPLNLSWKIDYGDIRTSDN